MTYPHRPHSYPHAACPILLTFFHLSTLPAPRSPRQPRRKSCDIFGFFHPFSCTSFSFFYLEREFSVLFLSRKKKNQKESHERSYKTMAFPARLPLKHRDVDFFFCYFSFSRKRKVKREKKAGNRRKNKGISGPASFVMLVSRLFRCFFSFSIKRKEERKKKHTPKTSAQSVYLVARAGRGATCCVPRREDSDTPGNSVFP